MNYPKLFAVGAGSVLFGLTLAVIMLPKYQAGSVDEESVSQNSQVNGSVIFPESYAPQHAMQSTQLPYISDYGDLSSSLTGVYFDTKLAVDEHGNIRVSTEIKEIFDFFLSAIEDEDLDIVLARINEYLAHQLEEPALSQAKEILGHYVDYKMALVEFEEEQARHIGAFMNDNQFNGYSSDYLALIKARLEQVKALRTEHLQHDVHNEFYKDEEEYDNYMLSRLQINADTSLSLEEKQYALAELDASMSDEFMQARNNANPVATLRGLTESSLDDDADTQLVRDVRMATVGAEATARLEQLDAQRNDWNLRYSSYQSQRDSILSQESWDAEMKQRVLQQLQDTMFSKNELIRVAALDNVNAVNDSSF